ncbi:Uncharacterized protein TCM_004542 [Theobroma cacao]|uniref:Uncharacterized protein n=1 Tax=Theobroma cacao TaxID=3641 RepID=A0A061DQ52_THECC|nr:Uncharacterized protein TCM_004542 [Theobroma cacao]
MIIKQKGNSRDINDLPPPHKKFLRRQQNQKKEAKVVSAQLLRSGMVTVTLFSFLQIYEPRLLRHVIDSVTLVSVHNFLLHSRSLFYTTTCSLMTTYPPPASLGSFISSSHMYNSKHMMKMTMPR